MGFLSSSWKRALRSLNFCVADWENCTAGCGAGMGATFVLVLVWLEAVAVSGGGMRVVVGVTGVTAVGEVGVVGVVGVPGLVSSMVGAADVWGGGVVVVTVVWAGA